MSWKEDLGWVMALECDVPAKSGRSRRSWTGSPKRIWRPAPRKIRRARSWTLGRAFLDVPARWLTGYRMQLFLYARALGADVWTPDCWYGISRERRPG